MDRNRLKQIQTSDTTDSRLNQEFVDWLRTKGLNWALVLMIALCAVMGWNLWKQRRERIRNEAWQDLADATLPAAYEDVAARFKDIDSVAPWALLAAADRYLTAVQTGVRFDRTPDAADYRLTPEATQEFLQSSDRLYAEVLNMSTEAPRAGFRLNALFGRAAVYESTGKIDEARGFLQEAVRTATEAGFPELASVAEERMATLNEVAQRVELPTVAQLPVEPAAAPSQAPVVNDDLIRQLLTPSESDAAPTTPQPTAPGAATTSPVAPPATVDPAQGQGQAPNETPGASSESTPASSSGGDQGG